MGLLDELDNAFDHMLNPEKEPRKTAAAAEEDPVDAAFDHLLGETDQVGPRQVEPRQVGPRQVGPRQVGPRQVGSRQVEPLRAEYDPIAQDVARLKAELAQENLVPIHALSSILDRCRRSYMLAALTGALNYLRGVDTNEPRGRITESLLQLLTTRKGTIRKLLRAAQLLKLRRMLAQLGSVREADLSEDMADYMARLQSIPEVSPQTLAALFAAGMWRPAQLERGSIHAIAQLAELEPQLVKAVKNAFKPESDHT